MPAWPLWVMRSVSLLTSVRSRFSCSMGVDNLLEGMNINVVTQRVSSTPEGTGFSVGMAHLVPSPPSADVACAQWKMGWVLLHSPLLGPALSLALARSWDSQRNQHSKTSFLSFLPSMFCCAGSSLWCVGFSSCGAQSQLPCSMWDPGFPTRYWTCTGKQILNPEPPGKSPCFFWWV